LTYRRILTGATAIVVAVGFIVAAVRWEAGSRAPDEANVSAPSLEALISPARYRQAVATLASEEMDGRRVGTPGGEAAVRFIENGFRQAGLLPGHKGSYRQDYRHSFDGEADATNVVGYLPGTDAEIGHQVVVISAHHDHLGRNHGSGCPSEEQGECVKYGANDNASGTAALLELAHALGRFKDELRRTVVFLSTDAEECGCTGVKQYVYREPAFPLADTIYNLNIDQIGEGAELETHQLNLNTPEGEDCDVDGEVFANRGIRSQTLVGGNANYHACTDTIDRMDFDAALRVVRRAARLALEAIQAPTD
jgi:hypothetical protein